jgi:small-conductance mechanosensitive channel
MLAFYLHIMGIDVSSILAFTGIGGVAFSFAAQDVVKNFLVF